MATRATGAELAARLQQVDVVGAHEILRETDDGTVQGRLAVVERRVFKHVAGQGRHLDLVLQVPLEAGVQHLALAARCRTVEIIVRCDNRIP